MGRTIVIQPGGYHPFHAGHYALYQAAQQAFPDAEIFVAATDDTSTRPFPFAVKEKLARLAGVEPGHFVRVKSPFRAQEITSQFDPEQDQLIFVRSEKDAGNQPQPGGVKRDGSPGYLQPYSPEQELKPFAQHAYMAYLPTVEFGPGLTSATQIRTAWPTLNPKRKTALVMSLYPRTQGNARLAQTVVRLLDAAILDTVPEAGTEPLNELGPDTLQSYIDKAKVEKTKASRKLNRYYNSYGPEPADLGKWIDTEERRDTGIKQATKKLAGHQANFLHNLQTLLQQKYPTAKFVVANGEIYSKDGKLKVIGGEETYGRYVGVRIDDASTGPYKGAVALAIQMTIAALRKVNPGMKPALFVDSDESGGVWKHIAEKLKLKLIDIAVLDNVSEAAGEIEAWGYVHDRRDQRVAWRKTFPDLAAAERWARSKNATILGHAPAKPVNEAAGATQEIDPELSAAKLYATQHYSKYADDPELAFDKWVQRSLKHGLEDDQAQFDLLQAMADKIQQLERKLQDIEAALPANESADYANESSKSL